MKINNREFQEFHASVVRFSPVSMEFSQEILFSEYSYYPIMGEKSMKPQQRELVIDFTSEEDISNFSAEAQKECILDLDDGYRYHCYPSTFGKISEEAYGAYTGTYAFYTLKQKPLVTEVLTNSIVNQGNIETNLIYEITSEKAVDDFQIGDIRIMNLPANKTIIIDGIDKRIYYQDIPDVSAFDSVVLSRFPVLSEGINEITKSDPDVQVIVKYYPTFM